MHRFAISLLLLASFFSCTEATPKAKPERTQAAAAAKPAAPVIVERGPKDDGRDYAKTTVTLHVRRKSGVIGDIVLTFYPGSAPVHVRNFVQLCESGFYDGTQFHRVIPGFMIQGGDPNTRLGPRDTHGMGNYTEADGSDRRLISEFSGRPHVRGTLSMARSSDPNSASSQFFICVAERRDLNFKYTVFGEVVAGLEMVDNIVMSPRDGRDHPEEDVVVTSADVAWAP